LSIVIGAFVKGLVPDGITTQIKTRTAADTSNENQEQINIYQLV
jgi:hypothetical protein